MSVWEVDSQSCLHLVPTYEEMEHALVLDPFITKLVVGSKHVKDNFCLAAGEKGQVVKASSKWSWVQFILKNESKLNTTILHS